MSFTEIIDWLLNWIDSLLSGRAKAIIGALWLLGGLITGIVAIFEHYRRKKADENNRTLQERLITQQKELDEKQRTVADRESDLQARESELEKLQSAVLSSDEQLWRVHQPRPFAEFDDLIGERLPPVIMIGNLKGGVGKTTLAANLAADWALTVGKATGKGVLLIDLDYQGSLSTTMFSAAGIVEVPSRVDAILDGSIQPGNLENVATNISVQLPQLPTTWVIPAYYSLAACENQLLVKWLLNAADDDIRYRLAKFLLKGQIQKNIGLVILDTPLDSRREQ